MTKIVFDADGLIKLAKAEIVTKIAEAFKCFVTKQVYDEILKGKEKMYEDAFMIEDMVKEKMLDVIIVKENEDVYGLGIGERSAFSLFKKIKGDAIVSDDSKFLSFLEKKNVTFVIPADMICLLYDKKKITKTQAVNALNKIRLLIKEEVYISAMEYIGG